MKTPEQMAQDKAYELGSNNVEFGVAKDAFLAGYQAAKVETNLPTSAKWISVKDRLPEKRDIGDIFLIWNAYDRDVSTVRWQPYGFDDVNDMYISHWMPLPAFPEDKGKAHWQELREFWKARNVTIPEWQEEK